MKLKTEEIALRGCWVETGTTIVPDIVSNRINGLINKDLILIGQDQSGWIQLYLDPADNRLWELTYPNSDVHGGGAPHLINIPREEAKKKYGII